MSFRNIQQNSVEKSDTFSISPQQSATINQYSNGQWFRNPTWPALPSISTSDEKVVGLYAIYPDTPVAAVTVNVTGGGTYTVDWGDGNVNTYSTATQANYTYDFNDVDLANTNGPVTFTDSGDTVNRNNHGYEDGMPISFDSITTTTGITAGQIYYVVNAATNSFQLAATVGGSPLTLTNDGSGIILPYKIAIIQIYPTSGAQFFQTTLTLNARNSSLTGLTYTNGWLDLAMSGRFTTLNLGGTSPTITGLLEQARILKHRLTSYDNLFGSCFKLQNVVEITPDSGISVTLATSMFSTCVSLQTIPLFDTANVTSTSGMFSGCSSLQTIPLLNTSNSSSFSNMFQNCRSLTSIPLIDTSKVTNMLQTFISCGSLLSIPLLNTVNVTNMNSAFNGCNSLETIPLIDTSNVANFNGTFNSCSSLKSIPLIDTSKATDMVSMFTGCQSLRTIPQLNTSNVTTTITMFNNCFSLKSIPLIDTSKVVFMTNMFQNCSSLQTLPLLDTSNATIMSSIFNGCTSLQSIPPFNTANVANVNGMTTGCTSLQQIPALNLASVSPTGNLTNFSTATSSVSKNSVANVYYTWSVASNKLSGARLDEVYTNLPTVFAQGTAVTFTDVSGSTLNDFVTLNNHGFAAGRTVSFASITTTTGISINTNYFVINPTTNTFQISTSRGGSQIALTGNGSGTLNGQTITVTGNWGTATDTPSIATAKGWAVTGS